MFFLSRFLKECYPCLSLQCVELNHAYSGTKLLSKKVVHENPRKTTAPKGLLQEVGNTTESQSLRREGALVYLDCMQTGVHAMGAK